MRILGLVVAGAMLAGPAFAQTGPATAGSPPSPYAAPPASADAGVSVNANLYGAPAASTGGGSALGGVMQTFDTIGAVRATTPAAGAATQAMAGPRLGATTPGVSAPALDPTPPPGAKPTPSKIPR